MSGIKDRIQQLQELAERAQRVIAVPPDEGHGECDEWEIKFELVFDIAREVRALGFDIEYCDPDGSYEEDARAYVDALVSYAEARKKYLEAL